MNAAQRRQCLSPFLILAILGMAGTGLGAEHDAETLPPGVVARFCLSPLRIGFGAAFAFAPDGQSIVAITPQGNLRRLDAQTGRLLERRQLTDRSDVNLQGDCSVQLSADGQTLAIYESSSTEPRVTVYEVATGKKIYRRESGKKRLLFGKRVLLAVYRGKRLPLSGERLRGVRAIEVLERARNAAARKLLQAWAEQTEDMHLAIEARLALERR